MSDPDQAPAPGLVEVTAEPQVHFQPKDYVAIILALGTSAAFLLVCVAVMWDAIHIGAEVSENGTQIISGAFGGLIGIIGTYLGYSAASRKGTPGAPGATGAPGEPGSSSGP